MSAKREDPAAAREDLYRRLGGAAPPAVYVFACDHPDAANVGFNVMLEFTPAGERIRRPGTRTAMRH